MKSVFFLSFILCLFTIASAQHHLTNNETDLLYTCPMHPEVKSNKPGKCSKCGMDLMKMNMQDDSSNTRLDRGNNNTYTPFKNFVTSVAVPTHSEMLVNHHYISNAETNIIEKPAESAHSGQHFERGTAGTKTIRYDLYVNDTIVNYTGKNKKGIAVNGSIPAPTLVFTIGDTAVVYVHNNADEPTSVHWHGVQLPNRMDGVPYLTQAPIPPNTTHVYKWIVVQEGTYWYHSHFKLQEQIGLYGALIFNKRTEPEIPTIPLILSDWSDLKPKEINRSLHAASDWFNIKKKAVQSYSEAIANNALGTKLKNEWLRMNAMDVSDVYYDRVFGNGKTSSEFPQFKAGDKVRFRIVNGAASSYFWLTWSGGRITVLANDGNDVEPVEVDRLMIATSETYDIMVTVPQNMKYEFLATTEDRTHYTSVWLGSGMEMPAKKLPRLKYFEGMKMMNGMMKMNGDMKPMGHMSLQQMDMNMVMYPEMENMKMSNDHSEHNMQHSNTSINMNAVYTCPMHPEVMLNHPGKCPKCGMDLVKKQEPQSHNMNNMEYEGMKTLNYNMLRSTQVTTLPTGKWKELRFQLEGNMNRYVWTLDNKTVSESDKILIKRGENVRIILYNNSMMRHPMHLHGHDFRLINQFKERSPLKNVVDILPMETDTLEFAATESGDWFFHCHILYHMMSGMGRVFSYENSPANPEIPNPSVAYRMLKKDDRMFHLMGTASLQTNGSEGLFMYGNTRWMAQQLWYMGFKGTDGYESETMFGRYFGKMQWLYTYVGFDYHFMQEGSNKKNIFNNENKNMFGQQSNKSNRKAGVFGIAYTLPMLIVADMRIDTDGKLRFQLSRNDIPLTPRLRMNWTVNTDKEYTLGASYIISKYLSVGSHYDSDMGIGAGVIFTY